MVRKVRKISSTELLKAFTNLRKNEVSFVAVSNKEWYSLFRDEIRNSIAIEGIFASRTELLDVLDGNKKSGSRKTSAILGYYEAASTVYEYGNSLFMEGEFALRLSDLRQIHTLLMRYEKQIGTFSGKPGAFRMEDVKVMNSHFTHLRYDYLTDFFEIYIAWLNEAIKRKKYEPVTLAALSHILFETVHPFRDGNGRVGRILLGFILIGLGFSNIAIKGTGKEEREKYYKALETGDDEFEKMLRRFEQGGKLSTAIIDRYAKKSKTKELENIITDCLNETISRLGKNLHVETGAAPLITLRKASAVYGYSQDYLRNLINRNKLNAQKRGKLWYVKIADLEEYISNTGKQR